MNGRSPTKLSALYAKWNRRLRNSGFKDIEDERGYIIDHKTVSDLYALESFRDGTMESIRNYFYWAEEMVQKGAFRGARDKKIWKLHAQGLSTGEISRQGRTDGPKKIRKPSESVDLSQSQIFRRLKKIRAYLKLQDQEDDDATQAGEIEGSNQEQYRGNGQSGPSRKTSGRSGAA